MPTSPDIPAAAETVPGFEALGWFALLAPAGTPDAIVRQVNKAYPRNRLDRPGLRKSFQDLGTWVRPMSPEETTQLIRKEQDVWRPIVQSVDFAQK